MYKHYLACLCKGTSIFSWKTIEIPSRDINIASLIVPDTYAYFFFDTDKLVDPSNLTCRQVLNPSHITYLGGNLYTYEELTAMVKEGKKGISIIPIPGVSKQKLSNTTQIINTSAGNWIPFFEGDILIST